MRVLVVAALLCSSAASAQYLDVMPPVQRAGSGGGGTGDVVGPASSVDLNLPRFSGTTGKLLIAGSGINIPVLGTISTSTTDGSLTISPNGAGVVLFGKQLVLSGITTDITGGSNEDVVIAGSGTGSVIIQSGDNNTDFRDSAGGIDVTLLHSTTGGRARFATGSGGLAMGNNIGIGKLADVSAGSPAGCLVDAITNADSSGTPLACVYGEGLFRIGTTQAVTCAAGVATVDPTSSVVYVNANSAACAITMSETTITGASIPSGVDVQIVLTANVSGAVTFPNVAGVHRGPAACTTTGLSTLGSSYRIHYASTLAEWVGVSCNSN